MKNFELELSDITWVYENGDEKELKKFMLRQPKRTHDKFRHIPDLNKEIRFFGYHGDYMIAYGYLGKDESFGYVVDREYQGFGLGKVCMKMVNELAYRNKRSVVKSEVDTDNEQSIRLMRRGGYAMYGPIYQTHKDYRIPVLFITYNRLKYSIQAMSSLLKTKQPIKIYIWDNGSTDGTVEWLKTLDSPLIDHIHYNLKNSGINKAFNNFIRRYRDCDYLAKVDNDTIVQSDWLEKLLNAMLTIENVDKSRDMVAVGAFMQRPPSLVGGKPWTFQRWVNESMSKEEYTYEFDGEVKKAYLAYNSYTGGTGVLFKTKLFWDHGMLFDQYPCLLGDWTTYQRLLYDGKNVAWCSDTEVKLLNIKEDGVSLNEDFPEYDDEIQAERDKGNAWFSEIGGPDGVGRFIEENGGREGIES